jgi:hypothetical protein
VRPLVPLDGGRFATSDLNDLYRRVIESNRPGKQAELQRDVVGVLCNGEYGQMIVGENDRVLHGLVNQLADLLRTTQRRVDFSAAARTIARPDLSPHQCALPDPIAEELLDTNEALVLVTPTAWRSAVQPIYACDVVRDGEDAIGLSPVLLASLGMTAGDSASVHLVVDAVAEAGEKLRHGMPTPDAVIDLRADWLGRALHEEVIDWMARAVVRAWPETGNDLPIWLLLHQ